MPPLPEQPMLVVKTPEERNPGVVFRYSILISVAYTSILWLAISTSVIPRSFRDSVMWIGIAMPLLHSLSLLIVGLVKFFKDKSYAAALYFLATLIIFDVGLVAAFLIFSSVW
jgi:hypothetical protein